MVEIVVDTNGDVDVLLREITRLKNEGKAKHPGGRYVLTWGDVYPDATLQQLFPERLSSVMNAAKNQRAIYFTRERLLMCSHDEVEIDILAPHLRILPETAIHSKSLQDEHKAAFKEAKLKALREHRESMLRLAMQGIELPSRGTCGTPSNGLTEEAAEAAGVTEATDAEEDEVPPPPPPPDDDDRDTGDGDSDDDDDSYDEEEEDEVPPPPPPPDDDD